MAKGDSKDSWLWFITLLKDDLHMVDSGGYTFISNEHMRIIKVLKVLVPIIEHRHCA